MKKRMYLAALAAAAALAMTACGGETATQEPAKSEKSAEKETKETKKSEDRSATRLVSVEKLEDYIKLPEYKGITLEKTVEEILDEAVDAEISDRLADPSYGYYVEAPDGIVQDGDMTKIAYVGKKDGEAFEGGSADEYDLQIGSGTFIPGFEEGMIGMAKGETRSIDLTFPEDYGSAELAGQAVVFDVTVQEITRAPEFSEEWVTANTEFATADEFKASIKTEMQEESNRMAEENLKNQAFMNIYSQTEVIEYPEEDLKQAVEEYEKQMQTYADAMGMELDAFLESQGYSREQFDQDKQSYSEMKLKQNMIVQAIMDAEGISLEDEESLALQDQMVKDSGAQDLAQLIDVWGQQMVDESIGLLRVENWLVANANVQEMVVSGDSVALSGDGNEGLETIAGEEGEEAQEGETDPALEEAEMNDPETEAEAPAETEGEEAPEETTEGEAKEIPAEETPAEETPAEETPAEETPAEADDSAETIVEE